MKASVSLFALVLFPITALAADAEAAHQASFFQHMKVLGDGLPGKRGIA